jgi:hypothetical protein
VAIDGSRKTDKGNGIVVIAITGPAGISKNMETGNKYKCWRGGLRLVLKRTQIDANDTQHLLAIGNITSYY